MASSKIRQQMEMARLEAQGYGVIPSRVQAAAAPDAKAYGVFQPAYAASLQTDATDPIAGPIYSAVLKNEADAESRRYAQALIAAHKGEMEDESLKGANAANLGLVQQMGTMGKYGLFGGAKIVTDPTTGVSSLDTDPIQGARANDQSALESIDSRFKDVAGGAKDLADAGIAVPAETVGKLNQLPLSTERPYNVIGPTTKPFTPTQQTDEEKAQASMISANASATRAAKGVSDSGGTTLTIAPGLFSGSAPVVTTKLKGPAALEYQRTHGGGASPAAPAATTSVLQGRIASAISQGSKVQQIGSNVAITNRAGETRIYNQAGQQVQ